MLEDQDRDPTVVMTPPKSDIEHALREQTRRLEALNEIALAVASDLDLERIVQKVTDAATSLSGAEFGAFFYNTVDREGERYTLYALSGAPRSAFEGFALPRNTAVFEPTFRGLGVIRSDDIRADRRYGKSAPHHGMPKGHLPVVSYLAVPVVSRSGGVHGGLFFGHREPAVFTSEAEEIVKAIAAHAAVAIDNARLLEAAQGEVERRREAELAAQRLAAIVDSSEDAIVSKDLNGVVQTWNGGAERIFGYSPDEVVGKSIIIIIPKDRQEEEDFILGQIRRGERVAHYETVRRRKDGSLVPISLTVSPVKSPDGAIVGASKIARDISERRHAEERKRLLVRELRHRVKNLLALSGGIVTVSARSAGTPQELVRIVQDRLAALDRAQSLTLPELGEDEQDDRSTPLHALVEAILSPYGAGDTGEERITVTCPEVRVSGRAISDLALLLHEFATNAAKYGALSTDTGRISVECYDEADRLVLIWQERGGPTVEKPPESKGFGSRLVRATVESQLEGEVVPHWDPEGLRIRLSVARDRLGSQGT